MLTTAHSLVGEIEPDDVLVIQSGSGKPRQRSQVNMHIVIRLVRGLKAWLRARVGRVHVSADHRQTHSGHGMHAKLLEYGDMTMSAANEDQIFHNRRLLSLYTYLSRSLCLSPHSPYKKSKS